MNNKGLILLNVALTIAVIVLFVMQFSGKNSADSNEVTTEESSNNESEVLSDENIDTASLSFDELPEFDGSMKLAYVNNDSLIANYEYMQVLSDELNAKMQSEERALKRKLDKYQTKVNDFQTEINANMITSQAEYERRMGELAQEEQSLMAEQQGVQQKLANINYDLQMKLIDHTEAFFKKLGAELGYDYVLTYQKGRNVFMYTNPNYDITDFVIKKLNEDYRNNPVAN